MSASLYVLTLTRGVSARASKLTDAILGGRVSHVLSEASYGVYLFHGFFIAFSGYFLFGSVGGLQVTGNARTVILWAITVPGSLIVALAVSRTIEKFGIGIGRAITS
jgi:peptidoglycan/LPS O-acetylase OafA/YrhL